MSRKNEAPPGHCHGRGGADAALGRAGASSAPDHITDGGWHGPSWEDVCGAADPGPRDGGGLPADGRARAWWAIVYPGEPSCPDWDAALGRLRALHVPMCISPEHRDVDPETGECKKPHRHLVVMYGGKKSLPQVRADIAPVGCVRIEPVHDLRGAVRYLCHLDEAPLEVSGKRRYDTSDLTCLSGFDPAPYLAATTGERRDLLRAMRQWCRDEGVVDMARLMDRADSCEPGWADLLDGDSRALRSMETYVRGRYHQAARRAVREAASAHVAREDAKINDR